MVSSEFREINSTSSTKHNLKQIERRALKALQGNPNLVIKNTDKGGGVVIQNRTDYLAEAHRILSDTEYYCTLDSNPAVTFQK